MNSIITAPTDMCTLFMLRDEPSTPAHSPSTLPTTSRISVVAVIASGLMLLGLAGGAALWWLDRQYPLPLTAQTAHIQTSNPQTDNLQTSSPQTDRAHTNDVSSPLLLHRLPSLDSAQQFARVVTDRHGRPLRAFPDDQGVWRYPVSLAQVSPHYLKALIQYEDRWFWHHPGINPFAILRASWQNLRCGCVISGGSTLTMQVARRLFPHRKTLSGKLTQALRALQLEWHVSKEQILTLYLNYAPMGGVIEGVEAASRLYLDKPAAELSLAEGALLAVLPQAPSRLRPDRHPQRALAARDKVLKRLLDFDQISSAEYSLAQLESLFAYQPHTPQSAPLLSRALIQQSQQSVIQTTLDADLQFELETLLAQEIRRFPKHHSAAILVLDNHTQEIRAYLGSADFRSHNRFGHVDMVHASRSPGSTLKPFIYALALDDGLIHGASLLRDVPRLRQAYRPDNFASNFHGPVTPRGALQDSLNLPAVQVLEALTPERFTAALSSVGAHYRLPAGGKPNLALALGAGGMSLWDLVMLYSSLMHQGQVREPRVQAISTTTIPKTRPSHWLLSPEAAWVTADLLRNPLPNRARSSAVMQRQPMLGWKTGTSYGYRDAWALGVTPRYTIGVWFGRPDGTPSPGHYGALTALPLLQRLFDLLDRQPQWPDAPDSVERQTFCWPLGNRLDATPDAHCHQQHSGWMLRQQSPPTLRVAELDGHHPNPLPVRLSDQGLRIDNQCELAMHSLQRIALWPASLEPWIARRWRLQQQLPKHDPRCPTAQLPTLPLQITGIEPDSRVRSALMQQGGSQELPILTLATQGGLGQRDWYLNGEYLNSSINSASLQVPTRRLGEQRLLVIDEQGNADQVRFFVD